MRSSGWNTLAQIAPVLVNIGLTPYVLDGLGLARFGLFILALTIADFLATVDGGLYAAAARYFSVYAGRDDRRSSTRLMCTLLLLSVLAGAVLFAVLHTAAATLLGLFRIPAELRPEGTFLLQVLGAVIALAVVRGVFVARLNADGRFALTSVVHVAHYLVYTTGVIITLVGEHGLRGMALTLLAQTTASLLMLAGPALRYLDRPSLGLQTRAETTDFLRFAAQAQVAGLSELINTQADALVIGAALDVRRVALFSAGSTFAGQLRRLPTNALPPAAAQLGKVFGEQGLAAATADFGRLQRYWVQFCTGWMAVAAASAFFGVTAWLGDDFQTSAVVAVVLLLGQLVRLWTALLLVYCQTVGRPDVEARYGVLSIALNLSLTALLVVPFGLYGVVAATALAQVGGCLYLVRSARRRIEVPVPTFWPDVPWAAAVVAAVVAVCAQLLVRPLDVDGPLGLLVAGAAAGPALALFAVLVLGVTQARLQAAGLMRRLKGGDDDATPGPAHGTDQAATATALGAARVAGDTGALGEPLLPGPAHPHAAVGGTELAPDCRADPDGAA